MPDPLSVADGGFRGGKIFRYGTVDSTMTLVAAGNFPWNATVVAAAQTHGRGRYERSWTSPETGGLYFTTWIRHDRSPGGGANVSQGAALALALLCRGLGIPGVHLKWPNDLLLGGRKAAGILAETYAGKEGRGIAVGIGIDVDVAPEVLAAVGQPATSLSAALGRKLSCEEVLKEFLTLWTEVDIRLRDGGFAAIAGDFRSFSDAAGREFRLSRGENEERVRVLRVADDGSLEVEPLSGGPAFHTWGGELLPC